MPNTIRTASSLRTAVFAPLESSGKAEQVERRIADAISLGLLKHGEKLPSESEMGRLLGVAPVTCREALEKLRSRGLVETRRGREGGSYVTYTGTSRSAELHSRLTTLSRVDLRDIGTVYGAIAGTAAEMAATRVSDDDVYQFNRAFETADFGTESGARRALMTFRLDVAAASHSPRLVNEEVVAQAEFGPLLWLGLEHDIERTHTQKVIRDTIRALSEADGARARALTLDHIAHMVALLIDEKINPHEGTR